MPKLSQNSETVYIIKYIVDISHTVSHNPSLISLTQYLISSYLQGSKVCGFSLLILVLMFPMCAWTSLVSCVLTSYLSAIWHPWRHCHLLVSHIFQFRTHTPFLYFNFFNPSLINPPPTTAAHSALLMPHLVDIYEAMQYHYLLNGILFKQSFLFLRSHGKWFYVFMGNGLPGTHHTLLPPSLHHPLPTHPTSMYIITISISSSIGACIPIYLFYHWLLEYTLHLCPLGVWAFCFGCPQVHC